MGAAGKKGQRLKAMAADFCTSSDKTLKRVKLADPVIHAGLKSPTKPGRALLRRVRNLLSDVQDEQAREEAVATVEKALLMIRKPERIKAIEEARGYARQSHFHTAVALTVAEMNLDLVDSNGNNGIEAETRKTKKTGKKHPGKHKENKSSNGILNKNQNPLQRVESIVASLLQEFVARQVIHPREIIKEFGANSGITRLTLELSNITRLPIFRHMPDDDGKMSVADIQKSRRQAVLTQDVILLTENPARVALIKIADALQQLRDEKVQLKTALHIQDMYLPLVREFGLWEIQQEMQQRLLHLIDPESEKEIMRQCKEIASPQKINESEKKIKIAVEDAIDDYVEMCEVETKKAIKKASKIRSDEQKLRGAFDKSMRESGISSKGSSFKDSIKEVTVRGEERIAAAQAEAERLRERERFVKAALKPKGVSKPSAAKIRSRRKTDYSIWTKLRDMMVSNAEKANADAKKQEEKGTQPTSKDDCTSFLERKVPHSRLGSFVNISSLYDVNGHQIWLPDIMTKDEKGSIVIDHNENYTLIKYINEHVSRLFEPVSNRIKDYIAKPKPTYTAFHNTYYINKNGNNGTDKADANERSNSDQRPILHAQAEVQFFTDSMKNLNDSTHAHYKERPTKETGHHPSKQGPKEVEERSRYYTDTVKRINARLAKENLPDHEDRTRIIVCDRNGDLMAVIRGTTLGELIQMAYANEGGVCNKNGNILPYSTAEGYIELLSSHLYQGEISQAEKELPHAAYIDFLSFTPPILPVKELKPEQPKNDRKTKELSYDIG